MATETGTDRDTGSERTILIELDVGRVERVDRPPSRWTALVIALFTALTCLGLGASVVLPRAIEPAPSQRSERPGDGNPLPTPSGLMARADPRQPPSPIPVEATARVATVAGGGRIVRIAGQAAVTVRSLDVARALAGRPVAGATVVVSSEATLTAATGPSGVGAAPWSVDLTLPSVGLAGIHDAVATVEVSWPASPAGPAGALVLVVSLGDDRGW